MTLDAEPSVPTALPGTMSPVDRSPLPTVEPSSEADVREAVRRAREAQSSWAARPLRERESAIDALAIRLLEGSAEVQALIEQELGRPRALSVVVEICAARDYVKQVVRAGRSALAPERIKLSKLDWPGKSAIVEAVPRGVIAIIAPWNYPLANYYKHFFPAVLAGNAVVLKPSEHTPRTGAWFAKQCEAVFPKDVVQIVQGRGDIGAALIDAGVDAVTFTGSVRTGRKVAAHAGERLIPCSVELGGKDAAIVLADCDLDRTAIGVVTWAMQNAGQDCSSIERVYVEEAIADAFAARVTAIAKKLRVSTGEGLAEVGPLQNEAQLRIVESHVDEAKQKGATVLAGGKRTGKGLGFEPTVLDRCTHSMLVVTDETFGPVLPIIRVRDAEHAIEMANDCQYGLNASVWTRDIARGSDLARRLQAGVVYVNNHSIAGSMPEIPWTGVKQTGPGVAASRHAYHTFVRRRTLFVDTNTKPDPIWFPADENIAAFGDAIVARGLHGGLGVMLKLLGLLGKRVKAVQALARGT
ncbi:MAG: aldehyde dehydrogenase family protein [Deltaproteobacteria bacterium]